MKGTIYLLLAYLGCCWAYRECCINNQILRRGGLCGEKDRMISMNCTNGYMMLKDVIINDNRVTTQDTAGFVFAEDPAQYCVGVTYRNDSRPELGTTQAAVVCFDKSSSNDIETTGILTLISVFFLAITFAVYMYLPQLRDLQGMCYMCMCISMSLGFLSLGILQLSPVGFVGEICTVTGFLVYFWMLATFFWMNVICVNMYRSIEDGNYLKKTEKTQFFWYSCYAWGCTFFFLVVALITNFVEGSHYKPGFGENTCWFSGRAETWIYFYGPVAVLITANVLLFVLSSVKLWQQSKQYEVNKLNNLKHKFLLCFKLFLVMGISWVFEIASFAHGQYHILWRIMDIFNCLQGVVIFFLLVLFRRRAMRGLASENCCLFVTQRLADKLSPHDDYDDQEALADENMEVRLN